MTYGASKEQWAHWSLWLGLTADLLPVVSKPNATISPQSQLKTLGKVPSRYDSNGQVVGIAKWTSINSTPELISKWERNPDYGICLQTRYVQAIDIDVADVERGGRIRARLAEMLGVLPTRARAGSARVACALRCPADPVLHKRVITLPDQTGAIEFLATGQQFIIAGTHPSGGKYFWEGGEPDHIPVVTLEQLDACWQQLCVEFGDGEQAVSPDRERRGAAGDATQHPQRPAPDPVVAWLERRGWITGAAPDRKRIWVACPWEEVHTSDTGPSSTAWLLAGTGGYIHGHFECLHAHCHHRTDAEFLSAVGFEQSMLEDFSNVPVLVDGRSRKTGVTDTLGVDATAIWHSANPGEGLTRGKKGWQATATNLQRALSTPGFWRRVQFDTFRSELVWSWWPGSVGVPDDKVGVLHPWREEDYLGARIALEGSGFEPMGKELLADALHYTARLDAFDSAQQWLGAQVWDHQERVKTFLEKYLGAEKNPYTEAVSLYVWSALAGRVMEPGCKADMVPILYSKQQGRGKSSAIEAMAPARDFYTTLDLSERDSELARKLSGVLVAELVELRGLKSREHEAIKAWVSQRADRWRPLYAKLAVTVERRFLMIGSTNEDDFLTDASGNRRWLPVTVGQADVDAIKADCAQLWAEGAYLFRRWGVAWEKAELLAESEHERFEESEIGEEEITRLLDRQRVGEPEGVTWQASDFTIGQLWVDGLGCDPRHLRLPDQKRIGRILRKLGFDKIVTKDGNRKTIKRWRFSTPVYP